MKKSITIVGGGTAALFLAAFLDNKLFEVSIYEKKSSLGRKFLVAGDGGFNLTHSENIDQLIHRFVPSDFLESSLRSFTNEDLITWLLGIGIQTFVGSSKRVFPEKGIKPINVLKSIEAYLVNKNVNFEFTKEFTGWDQNNNLIFNGKETIKSDIIVFALGGASWKITGSDGRWLKTFIGKGISSVPFMAQNCAFQVNWSEDFINKYEGTPLKNIAASSQNQYQKGELVITGFGLEGNAIYALSPKIQNALQKKKSATIYLDLKPMFSEDQILEKLTRSSHNLTKALKDVINLESVKVAMIKNTLSKEAFLDKSTLSKSIKNFPIEIIAASSLNEAISTSGGISLKAVSDNFELLNLQQQYCIGEMLDWSAPTGGYLIQACASMGVFLAKHLNIEKR